MTSGGTYRLVLSPELQAGLESGALTLARTRDGVSVMVRDATSTRFVGSGHLKPAEVARLANVAVAAWQVAPMVTQQHFLSEIDARLRDLAQDIKGLRDFLDNGRRAELAALHAQLRRDWDVGPELGETQAYRRLGDSAQAVFTAAHQSVAHSVLALPMT